MNSGRGVVGLAVVMLLVLAVKEVQVPKPFGNSSGAPGFRRVADSHRSPGWA